MMSSASTSVGLTIVGSAKMLSIDLGFLIGTDLEDRGRVAARTTGPRSTRWLVERDVVGREEEATGPSSGGERLGSGFEVPFRGGTGRLRVKAWWMSRILIRKAQLGSVKEYVLEAGKIRTWS